MLLVHSSVGGPPFEHHTTTMKSCRKPRAALTSTEMLTISATHEDPSGALEAMQAEKRRSFVEPPTHGATLLNATGFSIRSGTSGTVSSVDSIEDHGVSPARPSAADRVVAPPAAAVPAPAVASPTTFSLANSTATSVAAAPKRYASSSTVVSQRSESHRSVKKEPSSPRIPAAARRVDPTGDEIQSSSRFVHDPPGQSLLRSSLDAHRRNVANDARDIVELQRESTVDRLLLAKRNQQHMQGKAHGAFELSLSASDHAVFSPTAQPARSLSAPALPPPPSQVHRHVGGAAGLTAATAPKTPPAPASPIASHSARVGGATARAVEGSAVSSPTTARRHVASFVVDVDDDQHAAKATSKPTSESRKTAKRDYSGSRPQAESLVLSAGPPAQPAPIVSSPRKVFIDSSSVRVTELMLPANSGPTTVCVLPTTRDSSMNNGQAAVVAAKFPVESYIRPPLCPFLTTPTATAGAVRLLEEPSSRQSSPAPATSSVGKSGT
jgi:hypothetical protein